MEPLLPVVRPVQVWKCAVDGDIWPGPEEARRLQFVAHGSDPDLRKGNKTASHLFHAWKGHLTELKMEGQMSGEDVKPGRVSHLHLNPSGFNPSSPEISEGKSVFTVNQCLTVWTLPAAALHYQSCNQLIFLSVPGRSACPVHALLERASCDKEEERDLESPICNLSAVNFRNQGRESSCSNCPQSLTEQFQENTS